MEKLVFGMQYIFLTHVHKLKKINTALTNNSTINNKDYYDDDNDKNKKQ